MRRKKKEKIAPNEMRKNSNLFISIEFNSKLSAAMINHLSMMKERRQNKYATTALY